MNNDQETIVDTISRLSRLLVLTTEFDSTPREHNTYIIRDVLESCAQTLQRVANNYNDKGAQLSLQRVFSAQ